MSPNVTAFLIFGTLGLGVLWLIQWMQKRTFYKAIRPDEGGVRDEQSARDEIKNLKLKRIYIVVAVYMALCLITFASIAAAPTVRTVNNALHPSATPTVTNTPTRTPTRTASPTPRNTATPRITSTPDGSNFLTKLASPIATLRQPSGSANGSYIYVTRIVNKISTVLVKETSIVPVYQTVVVVVYQTVMAYQTVVVTPTFTSTPEPATETPTLAPATATPESPTPTETPIP